MGVARAIALKHTVPTVAATRDPCIAVFGASWRASNGEPFGEGASMRSFLSLTRPFAAIGAALWLIAGVALADDQAAKPLTPEQQEAEQREAFRAAMAVAKVGPLKVELGSVATIDLPEGVVFVPRPQADRAMRALGNTVSPTLIGLVVNRNASWLGIVQFIDEGHIADDDAKNWNVDELYKVLKDGTEADNAQRIARGYTPIEVAGWVEKPTYDAANRRLVWSVAVRDKGATSDADAAVNYNTYVLGRVGYLSLNLIDDRARIEQVKPVAKDLLSRIAFVPGKRYDEFNASTDRIAEYGIAALIGGVAAKKLGLLAIVFAFAAKFAKVALVVAAGGLYAVRGFLGRLFGGGRSRDQGVVEGRRPEGEA